MKLANKLTACILYMEVLHNIKIMKYFDIETKAQKVNGWERSLLELKHMMNGTYQTDNARSKSVKTNTSSTSKKGGYKYTSTYY